MEDLYVITSHLTGLENRMTDKGWKKISAKFELDSSGKCFFLLEARHPISEEYSDRLFEYKGDYDYNEAYRTARETVNNLIPSADAAEDAYRKSLANTIALGDKLGIKKELLDQLREQLSFFSSNLVTQTGDRETGEPLQ